MNGDGDYNAEIRIYIEKYIQCIRLEDYTSAKLFLSKISDFVNYSGEIKVYSALFDLSTGNRESCRSIIDSILNSNTCNRAALKNAKIINLYLMSKYDLVVRMIEDIPPEEDLFRLENDKYHPLYIPSLSKYGSYSRAIDLCMKRIENGHNSSHEFFWLGYCLEKLGMIDDAMNALESSLQIKPDIITFRRLIRIYLRKGRFKEVIRKLYTYSSVEM